MKVKEEPLLKPVSPKINGGSSENLDNLQKLRKINHEIFVGLAIQCFKDLDKKRYYKSQGELTDEYCKKNFM